MKLARLTELKNKWRNLYRSLYSLLFKLEDQCKITLFGKPCMRFYSKTASVLEAFQQRIAVLQGIATSLVPNISYKNNDFFAGSIGERLEEKMKRSQQLLRQEQSCYSNTDSFCIHLENLCLNSKTVLGAAIAETSSYSLNLSNSLDHQKLP